MGAVGANSVPVKLLDPVPVIDLYVVWRAAEINPAVASFLECLEPCNEMNPMVDTKAVG